MRIDAHHLDGIVCIALDEGCDLYNIDFFSNKSFSGVFENPLNKFDAIKGVYCDQLIGMIDEVIEKIPCYKF